MDGVKKMVKNTGSYKIVGEEIGGKMEISSKINLRLIVLNIYKINRMIRGNDDSAIESMAESADPIIVL